MVAARRKAVGVALIALAALFAVCIYAKFDPETTPFPKCPFYWATGLKCPGCGSQRALHQLLHLHVGAAFGYNACLVLFIPVLLFLFSAELLRDKAPGYYRASRHPALGWTALGLILLWWVFRNIFNL